MKQIHYTTAFKKDYKAIVKRGLDPAKLMKVIQLLAEDINRKNRFRVKLMAPRHEYAKNRRPKNDLRNWRDILKPSPHILDEQTVFDIMDFILGNTYFPENPEELEIYRGMSPYSRFACLDGYLYTISSQDPINTAKTSMIGKGAIQIEIQETIKKIDELRTDCVSNEETRVKLDEKIKKYDEIVSVLNLLNQQQEMNELSQVISQLSEKYDAIKRSLLDPEASINAHQTSIERNQERIAFIKSEIEQEERKFQEIQKLLQDLSDRFNIYLTKWKEQLVDDDLEIKIEEFFIEYKEKDIDYKGITDKISDFLKQIPLPKEISQTIEIKIVEKESSLENFKEFSEVDEENFIKGKEEEERFREDIVNYDKEIQRCDEQFNKADRQLLEELDVYKEKVNKIFRAAMNVLGLDGLLEFKRQGSSVNFELNIQVANRVGGVPGLIEESNFSGGEEQRTGVAFMVAIISQSRYPYVVWDEIDSDVGDDHREKIAEVIEKFFVGRKVIALSPQVLVRGYKNVFPLISEVFKNDDGYSRLTYFRPKIEPGGEKTDITKFIQ